MAEQEAIAASFRQHVEAFHASLPPEERTLLEQIFSLAESARDQGDVQGFLLDVPLPGGPYNPHKKISADFPGTSPL